MREVYPKTSPSSSTCSVWPSRSIRTAPLRMTKRCWRGRPPVRTSQVPAGWNATSTVVATASKNAAGSASKGGVARSQAMGSMEAKGQRSEEVRPVVIPGPLLPAADGAERLLEPAPLDGGERREPHDGGRLLPLREHPELVAEPEPEEEPVRLRDALERGLRQEPGLRRGLEPVDRRARAGAHLQPVAAREEDDREDPVRLEIDARVAAQAQPEQRRRLVLHRGAREEPQEQRVPLRAPPRHVESGEVERAAHLAEVEQERGGVRPALVDAGVVAARPLGERAVGEPRHVPGLAPRVPGRLEVRVHALGERLEEGAVIGARVGVDERVVLVGEERLLAPPLRSEDEPRSEEHTSELQSRENLVCRL